MFNDNELYQYPPFNPNRVDPVWNKDYDHGIVPVISSVGNGPRGAKGDPLLFTDLTQEELDSIYENVSFVSTTEKTGTYTTTSSDEAVIPIPIDDLDPDDILFVTIDGLQLVEGVDYTEDGNGNIVLTTPIADPGTVVCFRALGYALPDGDKNIVINQYFDHVFVITNDDIDNITS